MINPKAKLTLFYKDGINPVSEFSRKVVDYGRDSFSFDFKDTDTIYIGFEKPINAVYYEFVTSGTNEGTISMELWNGTAWQAVDGFDDDSLNMTRNAFMQWDRIDEDDDAFEHEESVPEAGMPELYYFRMTTDTTNTGLELRGMNVVFADDQDLESIVPGVASEYFLQGKTSHILIHQAVREDILQRFRNKGFTKQKRDQATPKLATPWDFLDIQELRQGAKYLALSHIFFNASDAPDDVFAEKSAYYRGQYETQIELAQLSFDFDNDGELDAFEEQRTISSSRMKR